MYNPSGLTELNNQHLRSKCKISTALIVYFVVADICFGLNFGFTKLLNKTLRSIVRVLSWISSLAMVVIVSAPLTSFNKQAAYLSLFTFQYILSLLILLLSKYTVCDFLVDIIEVNKLVDFDKFHVGVKIMAYSLTTFVVKLTVLSVFCGYVLQFCVHSIFPDYITYIPLLALDVVSVVHTLVFYYIYCHVKFLKDALKNREIDLDEVKQIYKETGDCFDRIKPSFDKLFIMGVILGIPKLMGVIWELLLYIKENASWVTYMSHNVFALHFVIQMCAPAVVAEMVLAETDSIKLILSNRLLLSGDVKENRKVNSLLGYMETRPLHYKVWRIVHVDLHLPVSLLSICTTYLIVIIQFTHLYN
uniref:Gustatory receptor n=1 Tax=Eogystia hippophaecolus TaxID=1206364 RepID=A0A1B3P5S7_EOGHI|nr:gustatory receptor [Eogystia hippophaecolus]